MSRAVLRANGQPFESWEPPTPRRVEQPTPSLVTSILYCHESQMFVPRVDGRSLPACRSMFTAQGEILSARVAGHFGLFVGWLGGLS